MHVPFIHDAGRWANKGEKEGGRKKNTAPVSMESNWNRIPWNMKWNIVFVGKTEWSTGKSETAKEKCLAWKQIDEDEKALSRSFFFFIPEFFFSLITKMDWLIYQTRALNQNKQTITRQSKIHPTKGNECATGLLPLLALFFFHSGWCNHFTLSN